MRGDRRTTGIRVESPDRAERNRKRSLTVAYKLLTWDGDIAGMKRGSIPACEPV